MSRHGAFVVLGAVALVVAGCATQRRPTAAMAQADLALREATASEAPAAAPVELRLARDKYERARQKLDDDEYDDARRLAEEATVDAQLARAKAEASAARRAADKVERSTDTLDDDGYRGRSRGDVDRGDYR